MVSREFQRALRWAQRVIVAFTLLVTIAMGIKLLSGYYFTPDYTVFWTAARLVMVHPEKIYDVHAMTVAQSEFIPPSGGPRPWAYPPTALLFFLPFSLLPFTASALAWLSVSMAAYVIAIRQFVSGRVLAFTVASPPIMFSALPVQVSLLIGAAILAGMKMFSLRPRLAGALIGVTACLKPQSVLLFPLYCIVRRNWNSLAAFLIAGICMIALSLMLGPGLWIRWIYSLDDFNRAINEIGLIKRSMTPVGIAAQLGFGSLATLIIQLAGVILGLAFAIWSFRQDEVEIHIVGLVVGGLLCSPYAMYYELAPLAPIAAAMLFSQRPWGLVASLPITTMAGMFSVPLMALGVFMDHNARAADGDPDALGHKLP